MAGILTVPKRVDTLPATQRPALGARQSDLDKLVAEAVKPLLANRDQFYLVAEGVTDGRSSIYEAFRRAGCTVRVARDATKEPLVRKTRKGEETKVPVVNIYALIPKGEVKNQSKRKPWRKRTSMNQAGEVKPETK